MRPKEVRSLVEAGFVDFVAETDIIYRKYIPHIVTDTDTDTYTDTYTSDTSDINSPYLNDIRDPYINEEHPVLDGGKKYDKAIFLRGYWKKDLKPIDHIPNLDERQDVSERDEGFAIFTAIELENKKLWNYKNNWTTITTNDIFIHGEITYKIIGVDAIGKIKSKYIAVKIRWFRDIRDG